MGQDGREESGAISRGDVREMSDVLVHPEVIQDHQLDRGVALGNEDIHEEKIVMALGLEEGQRAFER